MFIVKLTNEKMQNYTYDRMCFEEDALEIAEFLSKVTASLVWIENEETGNEVKSGD